MEESVLQPQPQSPMTQPLPKPPQSHQQQLQVPRIAQVIQVPMGQQSHFNPTSSSSPQMNHQSPRPPITPIHVLPPNAQFKPGQIQQTHVPVHTFGIPRPPNPPPSGASKQTTPLQASLHGSQIVPNQVIHPVYAGGGPQRIFVSPTGQQKSPQIVQVQPRPSTSNQPMIISVGKQPPMSMISPMQLQGPRQQPPRIVRALPQGSPQFQPRPMNLGQPQQYRQLQPLQPGMNLKPANAMDETKRVTPILIGSPPPVIQKVLVQNPNSSQAPGNIIVDAANGTRVFTPVIHKPGSMYVSPTQIQHYQVASQPTQPTQPGQPQFQVQSTDQSRQQKMDEAAQAKISKREEKERLKAEKEKLKREKKEAAEKAKKEKQERDRQEKEKAMCPHGKHASKCPTCRGPKKAMCPHGRQKSQCKDCGGSAICPHGRRKVICRDCGGTSICPHNRQKATCKECGGSAICIHSRQKFQCRDCGGSAICKHGKPKPYCKECGGSAICKHDKNKYTCPECKKENTGYTPRQKKPAANLKPKKVPASKAVNLTDPMTTSSTDGVMVDIGGGLIINGGTYADPSQGGVNYVSSFATADPNMQMPNSGMGGMENLLNSAELIESAGHSTQTSIIVQQPGDLEYQNTMSKINDANTGIESTQTMVCIIESGKDGASEHEVTVEIKGQHMVADDISDLNLQLSSKKRTIDDMNPTPENFQESESTGNSEAPQNNEDENDVNVKTMKHI